MRLSRRAVGARLDLLLAQPCFAELAAVRAGRVAVIDGNAYFNRPGPRLVNSAEIAALAIHPEHFERRFQPGREALLRGSELAALANSPRG